jgi:Holliday junction resolvase RusA-like endonuclease
MGRVLNIPENTRPIAMGPIEIVLPNLPPSTNNLFANIPGKGRVRSAEYNRWLNQSGLLVRSQCKTRMGERADITLVLEDRHPSADASNYIKPVEDLLVKVGILADDNAKHVRSVLAAWSDIQGLRIEIWPCQPNVAQQGRAA